MSFGVLMQQICIIFLEVMLGAVGVLCGKITEQDSKFLSNFTMTFLVPATILGTVSVGGRESGALMLTAGGLIFCLLVVTTFACQLLGKSLHYSAGQTAVLVGTGAMPNFGFVGLPLTCGILGEKSGLLITTSGMIAYNIWFFTYVVQLFQKERKLDLRKLITPCNMATLCAVLMMSAGLHFPKPVASAIGAFSSCTTPIAMMIIGIMLAQSDLKALIVRPQLYLSTVLRGVIFPLIFIGIIWLLKLDPVLSMGLAILGCTPAGTYAAVLAKQNGTEEELCSQSVAHSTLFMLITVPAILLLAARLFPI